MMPTVVNRAGVFSVDRLFDLQREIDRVFNLDRRQNGHSHWVPPMDVVETTDAIECRLELPGLNPADIDVHVENSVLTISGEKNQVTANDADRAYQHIERRYGRFERSFALPSTVDTSAVTARYEHGVLALTLPKSEKAKAHKVRVETQGATQIG